MRLEGGADDFKQIKGVGPKMEGMLNGMGFYHFDQVAAWSDQEVAWVDANLEGFKGRVIEQVGDVMLDALQMFQSSVSYSLATK